MKILDTHIHLFDTNRKQGVPYPAKDNAVLYRPALPARYRALAVPLGIVGAIAVEASPWLEDNDWLLSVCKTDPLLVGMVGNLDPEATQFRHTLDRLARDPLFLGIRYGNLWGRNLAQALNSPGFLDGMKHLQQAGLTLDTANPDPPLLSAVLRLSDAVPDLRIVIDHLPHVLIGMGDLRDLTARPQIFAKVSEVPAHDHREVFARMLTIFGERRLLFGSDWPNWDTEGTLEETVVLVNGLPQSILHDNARTAYRLTKR